MDSRRANGRRNEERGMKKVLINGDGGGSGRGRKRGRGGGGRGATGRCIV